MTQSFTLPLHRYERNEQANRDAFFPSGFFNTGDMGFIDHQGYLFVTGRIKEVRVCACVYERCVAFCVYRVMYVYFNTGDMGFIDHQGYLFVTGRSKEVRVCACV